ncbi:MAG: TadE/TadG family type IV pilus assembly protein [Pseudomonadota bacterium]
MDNSSVTRSNTVYSRIAGRLARFGRKKDGVVSIEAALLFPMMIILLLGTIDVTHAISLKRKVAVAASAVVDLTTQESNSVQVDALNEYIRAADAIMKPFKASDIKVDLVAFERDGNSVKQRWSHSRGSCGGAPPSLSGDTLEKLTQEDNDIVVARVCLNFQPLVGYIVGSGSWEVEESVAQRPRNGLTLECNGC